jgi:hypothetical protein
MSEILAQARKLTVRYLFTTLAIAVGPALAAELCAQ